jgi:predicted DNA-binding transcriptional regulator AlpA
MIGGAMSSLDDPLQEASTLQHRPVAQSVLEGFLSREQLAQQLGLSLRTIDRWEALHKGPPRFCVGRTVLYSIQAVREWMLSGGQQEFSTKKRHSYFVPKP